MLRVATAFALAGSVAAQTSSSQTLFTPPTITALTESVLLPDLFPTEPVEASIVSVDYTQDITTYQVACTGGPNSDACLYSTQSGQTMQVNALTIFDGDFNFGYHYTVTNAIGNVQ